MPVQGFESHLFEQRGWVLKIYRWFLLKKLSIAEEKLVWESQQRLLDLYAPDLASHLIAFTEDGRWSTDLLAEGTFCYGLRMRKATSFLERHWKKDLDQQKIDWARKIGISLASYHEQAPKVPSPFYNCPATLLEWLAELCEIMERYRKSHPIIPPMGEAILRQAALLPALETNISNSYIPSIHGDLNLANIVLYGERIQFIDPGNALPLGIGMRQPTQMALDIGWDLAALATSFTWHGNKRHAEVFLQVYADTVGISKSTLALKMQYWQILFFLGLVTICLKQWRLCSDLETQFARSLQARNITLTQYVQYFFVHAMRLLGLTNSCPVQSF